MTLEPHHELALSEALRYLGWDVGLYCLGGLPSDWDDSVRRAGLEPADLPRLLAEYPRAAAVRDFEDGLIAGAADAGRYDWHGQLLRLRDDPGAAGYASYLDWLAEAALSLDLRPERL